MGDNTVGQLGINENMLEYKYSPCLVDGLINLRPSFVACGDHHCIVVTEVGDALAWGLNEDGQLGCSLLNKETHYAPSIVNFDKYVKPIITQASGGSRHSGFLDEMGRLFMCGSNEWGQLGQGTCN